MMSPREVTFSVEIPSVDLSVAEIWPDGDAPEKPTAEDVADVMRRDKPYGRLINEWNLVPSIEVFGNHDASRATV
jgi:hypothetical protein